MRQLQQQPEQRTEQRTELESTKSELEIAHIAGRRPAVGAAIVVIGVLVAMVWVGMSGRTNPNPVPSFPAVADIPTADPPETPAANPRATPVASAEPAEGPSREVGDIFGVYAVLGDFQFATILSESEPGHLVGRLRVPLPPPASEGTFAFQQFSSEDLPGRSVPIADWPINVDALEGDGSEFFAVNAELPARRTIVDAPRPVQNGYRLTVVGERNGDQGELTIHVRIGPYRQLEGNDGILAWPVVYPLRPFASDTPDGPSGYCGPEAAPPAPRPDEPDCSPATR